MADANVKIRGGDGNAITLQSRDIDAAAPSDTNVLAWSASDSEWEPTAAGAGGGEWLDAIGDGASLDGVASLKSQGSSASATADYSKFFALDNGPAADSEIVFLLHGQGADGADAAADFVDSSQNGLVPSAVVGTVEIDTAQSTIGQSSSIHFPGGTDHLTYADSDAWTFAGDFTIDFFARFDTTVPDVAVILAPNTMSGEVWRIQRYEGAGQWQFAAGATFSPNYSFASTVSADTWYHMAVTRASGVIRFYQAGAQIGSDTASNTTTLNNPDLEVGRDWSGVYSMDGWLQEIRITNGTALWTGTSFTPPTAPVAGTSEMYVLDEIGNETKLSSHSPDGAWQYYSKSPNGEVTRINMEEVVRDLGELTGKDYIKDK